MPPQPCMGLCVSLPDTVSAGCRAGKPDQDATALAAPAEERAGGGRRARGLRRRGRGGAGREEPLLGPAEVGGEPSHSSAAPLAHPLQQQHHQQHADGPDATTQHSTYTNPVFADDSTAAAVRASLDNDASATGALSSGCVLHAGQRPGCLTSGCSCLQSGSTVAMRHVGTAAYIRPGCPGRVPVCGRGGPAGARAAWRGAPSREGRRSAAGGHPRGPVRPHHQGAAGPWLSCLVLHLPCQHLLQQFN